MKYIVVLTGDGSELDVEADHLTVEAGALAFRVGGLVSLVVAARVWQSCYRASHRPATRPAPVTPTSPARLPLQAEDIPRR